MDSTIDHTPQERKDDIAGALARTMPIAYASYTLPERTGLIVVDEVNGFCTVGAGALAPAAPNAQVDRMIETTDRTARRFVAEGRPIMMFRDTHVPGRAEPPYPPHCEIGSGEEKLVPQLDWLTHQYELSVLNPRYRLDALDGVSFLDKDVINGVVGGMRADGGNDVFDWIVRNDLEAVVAVGICTDICVLDAIVTLLSARNHHIDGKPMLGSLKDVVVLEPGCATYDMTLEQAIAFGLPDTAVHPQAVSHHMGLSIMQFRGAIIASHLA